MAPGQRCDVEKDSTTPRKVHPINVMLLRTATQERVAHRENNRQFLLARASSASNAIGVGLLELTVEYGQSFKAS